MYLVLLKLDMPRLVDTHGCPPFLKRMEEGVDRSGEWRWEEKGLLRPWKSEQFSLGQEEIEKLPNQNVDFPKREKEAQGHKTGPAPRT